MKILKRTAGLILLAAALWLCGLLAFSYTALHAKPEAFNEKTDAIVVLTGGKGRIYAGLSLFARGAAPEVFITGVNKDVSKDDLVSLWAGEPPLPACCLTLGYKARSTVQNAMEVKEWIKGKPYKSVRFVTGNYHIHRAGLELRHALPDVTLYAHPIDQPDLNTNHVLKRRLLISEYHKTVYRFILLNLGLSFGETL